MAPKGPASGNEAAHRRWEQTRVREVALQVVQMPPAEEAPRCCVTTTHGGGVSGQSASYLQQLTDCDILVHALHLRPPRWPLKSGD